MPNYTTYSTTDFAEDEYFQQWVLQSNVEAGAFWTDWLRQHPEKKTDVDEARHLLLIIGRVEKPLDQSQAQRIKHRMLERVQAGQAKDRSRKFSAVPVRIAASVSILMLFIGSFWAYQDWKYIHYTTGYGEKQEFILPDGSEVMLKANSDLKYARSWEEQATREVWLEGEAFFHVKKIAVQDDKRTQKEGQYVKFLVHATNAVDVAVLGTEFNVNSRKENTEVVLKSGKVRIDVKQDEQQKTLLMQPGDLVQIRQKEGEITQRQVDLETYIGWKENMLIFDGLALEAVAQKLEYAYGVNIIFRDSTLAQRKFTGFVPADNLDVLLEAFVKLYGLKVEKKGDQIMFSQGADP